MNKKPIMTKIAELQADLDIANYELMVADKLDLPYHRIMYLRIRANIERELAKLNAELAQ